MASANADTTLATTTTSSSAPGAAAEEASAKAVQKRYENLAMVRTKAVKGKGAWYWAHLEPLLVHHADTGIPKAVKLRCSLCDAVFSASNPSRTASEHLKRGTCPNFTSSVAPKPISTVVPTATPFHHPNSRKRTTPSLKSPATPSSIHVSPLSAVCGGDVVLASPPQQHFALSGGKDDLGALAMLEDSVKRLKSPKTSPGPALTRSQIDSAMDFLSDWVYESCGSVSLSSLEHPKFRAFLNQVGLPAVSRREFAGSRLDGKFEEARAESEARIRDAMFFQVACDGWKRRGGGGEDGLVNLTVNLPNGTSTYRRAVFFSGEVPAKYAEDVMSETVTGICGNAVQQCVGIVSDRFRTKALRSLESRNQWMVNLSCQLQGFTSLIKDFTKELPLFRIVADNCLKLAAFVNSKSQVRHAFQKLQTQEHGFAGLIRQPLSPLEFEPVFAMLEDVLSSARPIQLVLLDETFKATTMDDPSARELSDMVGDAAFWNEVEAVHSLVKLIRDMAGEIEAERPLVGRCLPLWDELRAKVKDWCVKFNVTESPVEKIVERRFRKNYHPAWSAALILDPLYLVRDSGGKYLPPFKCLSPEQEKDVDKLITRLVSREEAHIALMELMKWRTEGLDPVYARAVQMKEKDLATGKMKIANPQSSRLVWETYLTEFKSLGKVAVRLIFLRTTSSGFKCNWSVLRWATAHANSIAGLERAQKLIFIAAHSKLERRDFSSDDDRDAELLAMANGEDDMIHDSLVDTTSSV